MATLKHDLAEFSNVADPAAVSVWHQFKYSYLHPIRACNNGSINVTPFGMRSVSREDAISEVSHG